MWYIVSFHIEIYSSKHWKKINPKLVWMVLRDPLSNCGRRLSQIHVRWQVSLKLEISLSAIFILSISRNVEFRAKLSDTILKEGHLRSIQAKSGLIWFSYFKGEDLNIIFYQNMRNLHNWYKSAKRTFCLLLLYCDQNSLKF
jgi:hypothetical protein